MADDEVTRNLQGMDELDFKGWNGADWQGVFAHYHTDDVLVDWKGNTDSRHPGAHRCHEGLRRIGGGHARLRSRPTRSGSDQATGRAWSGNSKTVAGW